MTIGVSGDDDVITYFWANDEELNLLKDHLFITEEDFLQDIFFLPIIIGIGAAIGLSVAAFFSKITIEKQKREGQGTIYLFRRNEPRPEMSELNRHFQRRP